MPTGHYRFRRSLGNVASNFRGARPDTYPLFSGLLDQYVGAAAAYSLRTLAASWLKKDVVEVRRASDNTSEGFTEKEITDGTLVDWVNEEVELPLDKASGAAAAYSLRNLSTSYTGNVVDVRRSSDDAEDSFTAAEVADGTLTDWVNTNFNVKTYDFSSHLGAGGLGTPSNITLEGDESIAGVDDALKISVVSTGSDVVHRCYENLTPLGTGSSLRITLKAYRPSSNVNSGKLGFSFGSGFLGASIGHQFFSADDTWEDFSFDGVSANSTRFYLQLSATNGVSSLKSVFNGTTGDHVYIKDLKIDVVNSSGHVTQWYDQSGNGNHAIQTDAASQPKIVNGGSLVSGGLDFDGVDDFLSAGTGFASASKTVFCVNNPNVLNSNGLLGFGSSQVDRFFVQYNLNAIRTEINGANASIAATAGQNLTTHLHTDDISVGINGSPLTTTTTSFGGVSSTAELRIGQRFGVAFTDNFDGSIEELIIYNSDQSDNRPAIESNIASHYSITLPTGSNPGSVDGFVSTWYDQSGNANDAVQVTTTAQPKIVDAGSLVSGGLDFDGVDDFLELGNLGLSQPNSVVFVHNSDTDGESNTLKNDFLDGTTVSSGRTLIDQSGASYRIFAGGDATGTTKTIVANQDALVFTTLNGSSSEFALDGSNETALNAGTNGMDEMTLGASISGGRYDGTFAELIIYNSDQSANRVAIETNINSRYSIY